MRNHTVCIAFLLTSLHLFAQQTSSPALTRMAGCTLQGHTYTCSKADLERALGLAKTITYTSQPANHASDAALTDLIKHLGKIPATGDTPSDLTFLLEPAYAPEARGGGDAGTPRQLDVGHPAVLLPLGAAAPVAGVEVGPGTVDLARLRVLLPSTSGAPGKLLWVQTFNGDSSMAWPAIARATTLALQDQLHSR